MIKAVAHGNLGIDDAETLRLLLEGALARADARQPDGESSQTPAVGVAAARFDVAWYPEGERSR